MYPRCLWTPHRHCHILYISVGIVVNSDVHFRSVQIDAQELYHPRYDRVLLFCFVLCSLFKRPGPVPSRLGWSCTLLSKCYKFNFLAASLCVKSVLPVQLSSSNIGNDKTWCCKVFSRCAPFIRVSRSSSSLSFYLCALKPTLVWTYSFCVSNWLQRFCVLTISSRYL